MTGSEPRSWADVYKRVQATFLMDVPNAAIYPRWIEDREAFWYERRTGDGLEIRIVEAARGENRLAFAAKSVARALDRQLDTTLDPDMLILGNLTLSADGRSAHFDAFGKPWHYRIDKGTVEESAKTGDREWAVSPDKKKAVFVRDNNLFLRDIASGEERALTRDGAPNHAYALPPIQRRGPQLQVGMKPEGAWSPDSKWFLTLQTDERHVPELPILEFAPPDGVRPKAHDNPTSLPGDPKVTEFRIFAVDVATGRHIEARYPRLAAVRMNDTPFAAGLAWWSVDGRTAYFVDIERGEKAAHVVAFDVATGATKVVFSEHTDTYLELSVNVYAPALVTPVPATNELVWYSERSGHGHLYLYDLETGKLKNAITQGPWQVRDVQHVDPVRREVFFTAAGIAPDEDPYVCKPCIASLDGGEMRVVSSEPGEHLVWRPGEYSLLTLGTEGGDRFAVSGVSPSGDHFVETVGGMDRLPVTVLRKRSGEQVAVVEKADGTNLPADWQWPEAVKLKAADGKTDIYGLLFKPPGYDPDKSYPVIDYIYGGPQVSNVPKIAFGSGRSTNVFLEVASLAMLGAFALVLDGRGTAFRERAFREASHCAIHTGSNVEDHIAAIRRLAERYKGMDIARVGITGHSGGGYMTAMAAFRYGDFFKVAVASAGNYDQALFWHCWGERYHGPFEPEHYKTQAARTYAAGLTGKIMFIHGLMDTGVHPAALFQMLQVLIEENKDWELVLLPRSGHELSGYGRRRRLDFFVTHLFGSTPEPAEPFVTGSDKAMKKLAANAAVPEKKDQAN